MNKLLASLMILFLVAGAVAAQDWTYDEANEIYQNCQLIDLLKEAHGEAEVMRFPDGDTMSLAFFLDRDLLGVCAEWNRGEASDDFYDTPAEPETQLEISAVLEDHEVYSIDEADCSVMAKDRFDEDLNVSIAGAQHEEVAVAVYLPGTSQALDMPNVNSHEAEMHGRQRADAGRMGRRTQLSLGSLYR